MEVLLSILLWTLAVAGLLVALLIAVPFGVRAAGSVDGFDAEGSVQFRWGGGLLAFRLASGGRSGLYLAGHRVAGFEAGPETRRKKAEKRRKKKEKRKEKGKRRGLGWALGNRPTLTWLVRRAIALLHLEGSLEGVIGLGDPADTALLHGSLESVRQVAPRLVRDVSVDWVDEQLWLAGRLSAWVWPLQIIVAALAALARKDVRRALRTPA